MRSCKDIRPTLKISNWKSSNVIELKYFIQLKCNLFAIFSCQNYNSQTLSRKTISRNHRKKHQYQKNRESKCQCYDKIASSFEKMPSNGILEKLFYYHVHCNLLKGCLKIIR